MSHHVRAGQPKDVDAAAEALAEAFTGYAWATWTVDAENHTARLRDQHALFLRHILVPYGAWWVVEVDDQAARQVVGAAAWLPPQIDVPGETWLVLDERLDSLAGDRSEHGRIAERACRELRPAGPYWYLGTVGVHPAYQRRGLATELLAPGIAAAQAQCHDAYLETSSEGNVRLYERLGFVVSGHVTVPGGGPEVWGMIRRYGIRA